MLVLSATMLILYSQHLLLSFQIIETIRSTYVLVLQTYIEYKYIYSSFANSRHILIYIRMYVRNQDVPTVLSLN